MGFINGIDFVCDFCDKELSVKTDEVHYKRSTMDGETIEYHSCSNPECLREMKESV